MLCKKYGTNPLLLKFDSLKKNDNTFSKYTKFEMPKFHVDNDHMFKSEAQNFLLRSIPYISMKKCFLTFQEIKFEAT
jgi:hypothetical protein